MNLLPFGPQLSQLDKEEGDGCHLDGTCVPRPGVLFLALVSCLPFPHECPLVSLGHDPALPYRSVDFLLDSSLRKLYPSMEKPSSS